MHCIYNGLAGKLGFNFLISTHGNRFGTSQGTSILPDHLSYAILDDSESHDASLWGHLSLVAKVFDRNLGGWWFKPQCSHSKWQLKQTDCRRTTLN